MPSPLEMRTNTWNPADPPCNGPACTRTKSVLPSPLTSAGIQPRLLTPPVAKPPVPPAPTQPLPSSKLKLHVLVAGLKR